MTSSTPLASIDALDANLREPGFARLDARSFARLARGSVESLDAWRLYWDALPVDEHLRDGGHYRRRRHSCFVVEGTSVVQSPHRAHWQSREYNSLHGGIERWFEPMDAAIVEDPAWSQLLVSIGRRASTLRGSPRRWFVEAHPIRIDTTDGIGRPTPEGPHHDGVDLVAVVLVERCGVTGGETRIFDPAGPTGMRFTMTEPWSAVLLDDVRIVHESTPIQPADRSRPGHRDVLVLTFRSRGFQASSSAASGSRRPC